MYKILKIALQFYKKERKQKCNLVNLSLQQPSYQTNGLAVTFLFKKTAIYVYI